MYPQKGHLERHQLPFHRVSTWLNMLRSCFSADGRFSGLDSPTAAHAAEQALGSYSILSHYTINIVVHPILHYYILLCGYSTTFYSTLFYSILWLYLGRVREHMVSRHVSMTDARHIYIYIYI